MLGNLQSAAGLIAFPLIAWLLSRPADRLAAGEAARVTVVGIALQLLIAGTFVLVPQLAVVFQGLAAGVQALQDATLAGMRVLFGHLAGGPAPYDVTNPQHGFVLALQALPLVLFVSVLSKLLYHFGILQRVVGFFAFILQRTMGVSGPLGTAAAANIFVGMVEAPLMVRPYVGGMSRGALFATMTAGMATVAGTVMALYAALLEPRLPGAAGHILIASLISAPAAILIARLMVPWRAAEEAAAAAPVALAGQQEGGVMGAITEGTSDGLRLLVNIVALMVVMIALVALADMLLALLPLPGGDKLTVERLMGWLAAPLAFLAGIELHDVLKAGELIGIKSVLNELLAYLELSALPREVISDRSRLILTYVLCGFANPGSLGIMTGGLVAMAPERRADILALAPWSLVSGTLATLMTGAVIGVISF
jgi:CNT family concentrative nucleoside transporter